MPRLRKTDAQRRAERFGELYRVGKARLGMTDEQVGQMLDMSSATLRKKRRSPGEFSFSQIITMGAVFGWSDEDYLAIIHPQR